KFFYIYGDTFSLMNYAAMRNAYAKKNSPIGMQRTKRTDSYADADVVEEDTEGKFVAQHSKPHQQKYPHAYRLRGASILEKEILQYIPDGASDLAKDVLPRLIAAGKNFYGYECDEYSQGIDTLEKLHEVEAYLKKTGENSRR